MTIPIITDLVETAKFALIEGVNGWIAEKAAEARRNNKGIVETALLGKTTFVLTTPNALRSVFYDESRCHRKDAMVVTSKILTGGNSEDVVTEMDDAKHATRKAILNNVGAENIIDFNLQHVWAPHLDKWIESIVARIDSSAAQSVKLNFYPELEEVIWTAGLRLALGLVSVSDSLLAHIKAWKKGYISLPADIPFTAFHYAVQGRDAIYAVIREQLVLHRQHPEKYENTLMQILLLHQNSSMSDDALVHESLHFFEAITGIPMVIANTLIGLKQSDPVHSAALYSELNSTAAQEFLAKPTTATVKNLPILSRTVKEALRRYVVLPFRLGTAVEQTEFEGVMINKGDTLMAALWTVNQDPDVYESPEKFYPDRWAGNEFGLLGPSKNQHPNGLYEFVAFGGTTREQRQCAGSTTAFTILRFAVAKVLAALDVQVAHDQELEWKQNLVVPVGGMPCVVRKRD
ncbi:UNVERIFIED_CONTAM: hypothetical protein HDU68_011082 [Siphonaria sp. JEL0065]|nr:hypothetical protein HDU68_011082 [Siphonaria sp. JEL0065]